MDLGAIVASGMRAIPTGVRGTVTVKRPAERGVMNRTTGVYAPPASPTPGYVTEWTSTAAIIDAVKRAWAEEPSTSGQDLTKYAEITVPAADVLFNPQQGMDITMSTSATATETKKITGATPVGPTGAPALWTIRVER
jgi:hypothetical protein